MTLPSRHRTKADRTRLDALHDVDLSPGCMACLVLWESRGYAGDRPVCGPITEQHMKGRTRKGCHALTFPLSAWHHQAVPLPGYSRADMIAQFGPSLADGSKRFVAVFGTQESLRQRFNDLIGVAA